MLGRGWVHRCGNTEPRWQTLQETWCNFRWRCAFFVLWYAYQTYIISSWSVLKIFILGLEVSDIRLDLETTASRTDMESLVTVADISTSCMCLPTCPWISVWWALIKSSHLWWYQYLSVFHHLCPCKCHFLGILEHLYIYQQLQPTPSLQWMR